MQEMTRDQVIEYMCDNRDVKVKHRTIMPETAEKFVEKTCPADCKGALNNGKRK